MAKSYFNSASRILEESRASVAKGAWNLAVRRAQESVELGLKAALRLVGLEVPRVHDVGVTVRESASRFPDWWNARAGQLARISRDLRRYREMSLYGDDETGLPPERIFSREDAEEALRDADFVIDMCARLFKEHSPAQPDD